jgi:hypothetical protein
MALTKLRSDTFQQAVALSILYLNLSVLLPQQSTAVFDTGNNITACIQAKVVVTWYILLCCVFAAVV